MKITTIAYVHCDKETMYNLGEKLGLTEKALGMFAYALTEVKLTLEVDTLTGLAKITQVDGRDVST